MKKLYTAFSLLALIFSAHLSQAIVVTITQSGNAFSPMGAVVSVGDVIHFEWTNGNHNTTSLSIPAGAASWAAPLNSGNPSFDYTVTVAGTYVYQCTFHAPTMSGGFEAQASTQVEQTVAANIADFTAGMDANNMLHVHLENYQASEVVIRMIDIMGREVSTLLEVNLGMGEYQYRFDMAGQNRGIYFVRLEQSGRVVTRKIMLN